MILRICISDPACKIVPRLTFCIGKYWNMKFSNHDLIWPVAQVKNMFSTFKIGNNTILTRDMYHQLIFCYQHIIVIFTELFLYFSDYDSINVSISMFWHIVLVDLSFLGDRMINILCIFSYLFISA